MNPRTALTRALACVSLAVLGVLASCSADQQSFLADGLARQSAALAATRNMTSVTDAQLARLAKCESGGNPQARSRSGRFHGLYQFDQRTWNGVAASVLPDYVGVAPSAAPAEVQSAMARALYAARGRSPWPVCGRRM